MQSKNNIISFFSISLITLILTLGIAYFNSFNPTAIAQSLTPENVAIQAYQQLDNFPLENQYISQQTGQIAPENTLITRLIRYHQYIKRRPVQYRFDWKLTLADYLDSNEPMLLDQYPGRTLFTINPFEEDRRIIQSLTRQQRNQLINILVNIYNPQNANLNQNNSSDHNQQNNPILPNLPPSGAADLLRF